MEFGFLLDDHRFDVDGIEIKPRHDHDDIISRFYESGIVANGWILPPINTVLLNASEKQKFKHQNPKVRSAFFTILPTHSLIINPHSDEKAKFLILSYGFLLGMYLTPAGHSYLSRIPYEKGKLNGLFLGRNDCKIGMSAFNNFYNNSSQTARIQMFAILHWFLVGQTYEFEWDRFEAQYKVLDGLYRILGENQRRSHSSRPIYLAEKYGIKLPIWAKLTINNNKSSRLSVVRNELAHEAKYASSPIGYAYPEENFDLELVAFNTKLIASTIGLKSDYLNADPDNRQMYAWDLK